LLAKNARGSSGRVTLPAIGALIGEMYSWQLYSEDGLTYMLKANCNHLHESLWEEAGSSRRIELELRRSEWYEAKPIDSATISRNGRNFTIKGVTLARLEN